MTLDFPMVYARARAAWDSLSTVPVIPGESPSERAARAERYASAKERIDGTESYPSIRALCVIAPEVARDTLMGEETGFTAQGIADSCPSYLWSAWMGTGGRPPGSLAVLRVAFGDDRVLAEVIHAVDSGLLTAPARTILGEITQMSLWSEGSHLRGDDTTPISLSILTARWCESFAYARYLANVWRYTRPLPSSIRHQVLRTEMALFHEEDR